MRWFDVIVFVAWLLATAWSWRLPRDSADARLFRRGQLELYGGMAIASGSRALGGNWNWAMLLAIPLLVVAGRDIFRFSRITNQAALERWRAKEAERKARFEQAARGSGRL